MPYRVIIAGGGGCESPAGTYVIGEEGLTLDTLARAEVRLANMRDMFPEVTYRVVYGAVDTEDVWEDIAAAYRTDVSPSPVVEDDEEEDEEEEVRCDECGEEGHDSWHHENYCCESCDWTCGAHGCSECVSYGPDGDWCESCAENYEDESTQQGSPGLSLRECSACGSYDVHHDDVAERFVCDCEARRLVANRRPVTLAHELPPTTDLAVAV